MSRLPRRGLRTLPRAATVAGFRPPRQERSRVTVERIVRATQELLAERGSDTVTVQQIVARADSSVGSFYARFDDRDAAVRYAEQRFWDAIESRWDAYLDDARWNGKGVLEIVARLIRDLVRAMMADRARLRAFLVQAFAHPESGLAERTEALDRRIARGVVDLLRAADATIAEARPAWMPETGFVCVLGAIRDAVVLGEDAPEADRRLGLSLVRMYGTSLGLDSLPESWSELLALCTSGRRAR